MLLVLWGLSTPVGVCLVVDIVTVSAGIWKGARTVRGNKAKSG